MASPSTYQLREEHRESRFDYAQTRLPLIPVPFWIIGLCVGVLIVCVVALAYGHTFASLNGISRLGLAQCPTKPCFRGMTPGVTSWIEVRTAYQIEPTVALHPVEGEVVMFPSLDGRRLGLVLITPSPDHPISAGEIIALYGQPDCIDIALSTGVLVLHYMLLDVTLGVLREHFNPETPVQGNCI